MKISLIYRSPHMVWYWETVASATICRNHYYLQGKSLDWEEKQIASGCVQYQWQTRKQIALNQTCIQVFLSAIRWIFAIEFCGRAIENSRSYPMEKMIEHPVLSTNLIFWIFIFGYCAKTLQYCYRISFALLIYFKEKRKFLIEIQ